MSTEPSRHGDVTHVPAYRFGIAAGMSGWGWHAVDLECSETAASHGAQRGHQSC